MPSISCEAVHLSSIPLAPPPTLFHHASLDDNPSCTRTAGDVPCQLLLLTKDPSRSTCSVYSGHPACSRVAFQCPSCICRNPRRSILPARSQRAPAAILPRTPASSQPARCRRDLAFQGQCQDDCTSRRAGSGKGFNHNVSIRLVC